MNEHPFQSFIHLIDFDQKTVAIENLVEQRNQEIDVLKKEHMVLNNNLEKVQDVVYQLRKQVDEHELRMKEFGIQEDKEKKRLESVANQKEYQSVRKEIEHLKQQQFGYEETILATWNQLEHAQRAFEAQKKEHDEQAGRVKQVVQEKETEVARLVAEISERHNARKALETGVPAEWIERYAMMRSRVADPVVPVKDGLCSACFYQILAQDMILLRRNKLLPCKECYRFLYIETAQQS